MGETEMRWWPLFRRESAGTPSAIPEEESSGEDEVVEKDEDEELIRKVADKIVRMRMTVPAIFFLESSKPLAFLGSQLLIFFEPFIQTLFNIRQYQRFALLMEHHENWERLIRKMEDREAEYTEQEKKARQEKKEKDKKRKKE
jgi:hypothetical protein